ncbi:hypothetical protein [Streptomyces zagrosensis]|uniref:Uncharacterized protein n=1 Tax=Streptomyces zagrosensis TaxID=1042984 RepID=A0A7W9Q897_9ACTN|nr:hypothetical protein [Streptomyces zagrosensis]MBB5935346.1 hypothetical protein [Streptomyces zagrosensis]
METDATDIGPPDAASSKWIDGCVIAVLVLSALIGLAVWGWSEVEDTLKGAGLMAGAAAPESVEALALPGPIAGTRTA